MSDDLTISTGIRRRPAALGDVLSVGFATAVAMWFVGYVTHMVGGDGAGPVTAAGMGACALAGGFVAGRLSPRGAWAGVWAGLCTGAINLMILSSVLHPRGGAAAALAASVPVTGLVMGAAAFIGAKTAGGERAAGNWTGRFAFVAVCATAVLLLSGGLVTAKEAGLAVEDWPTSFGHNMWAYPLAKMTGNIYYEHTHRLYGTLVGLTTLALMIHLWIADRRMWVKVLALVAFIAVCAQGVMGGLRVTEATSVHGAAEVATLDHETASSAFLRVAHGVFAQVFFALMTALAVVTSAAWKSVDGPARHRSGSTERILSIALVVLLVIQLILGARVRHLQAPVTVHIIVAALVLVAAFASGMRCWGIHGDAHPPLRRLGIALVALVGLQVTLGFIAFGAKGMSDPGVFSLFEIVSTTAHQFTGALLLAVATACAVVVCRRIAPLPASADADSPPADDALAPGGQSTRPA